MTYDYYELGYRPRRGRLSVGLGLNRSGLRRNDISLKYCLDPETGMMIEGILGRPCSFSTNENGIPLAGPNCY